MKPLVGILIVLGMFSGPGVLGAEPLLLYGYYHAQTYPFGFLMEDVADFTNVLILEIGRYEKEEDILDKVLGIPRALDLGYNVILGFEGFSLNGRLSPEEFEAQVGLTALQLRKAGYYRPEALYAIYLMDEPPNFGFTLEDQELFLEIVERYFPGFPTMINYSYGQVRSPLHPIPEGVDIVSFDAYYFQAARRDLSQPALEEYLESAMSALRRKAPGKPIVYIAQSYQHPPSGYFFPTNEQLSWMLDFSLRTPEIVGHLWFMLGTGQSGGEAEEIEGTVQFPDRLEYQRQLGRSLQEGFFRADRRGARSRAPADSQLEK
jgi:hypothetical protein